MRAVECWGCGRPITAPGEPELVAEFSRHLREAHDDPEPDPAKVQVWIARKGYDPARGLFDVLWVGRLLAGAAVATFLLLALVDPADGRTVQLLTYGAFAAMAGTGLCIVVALGRLLDRR